MKFKPREQLKEKPIRIERKLIHGVWVDVKIYKSNYVPIKMNEARPTGKRIFDVEI